MRGAIVLIQCLIRCDQGYCVLEYSSLTVVLDARREVIEVVSRLEALHRIQVILLGYGLQHSGL